MAEPLFLKAQMHDKIWGGTKLRDEFGYDIPTETTGEYWAISAHPMVFQLWIMVHIKVKV